jgi:hypothetical protein
MPQPPSSAVRPSAGLRRLVWLVRLLTLAGAAALLAVPVLFWTDPGWVHDAAPGIAGLGEHAMAIDEHALLLGALASLPGVLLGLAALCGSCGACSASTLPAASWRPRHSATCAASRRRCLPWPSSLR